MKSFQSDLNTESLFNACKRQLYPSVANQLNTFWIHIGLQSLPLWLCNCCYIFAKQHFSFQRLRRWRIIWNRHQTQQQQQWAIRVKPTQQQDHQQTTRSPSWKTSDTGDDFLQLCTFWNNVCNFERKGADQSSLKMKKWLLCPMWRSESNRI